MSLINLFSNPRHPLLNIYCTAGFPKIDSLPTILKGLEEAGADIIEIGIPYSDPLSDGPTIQESSQLALQNGITLDLIFSQLNNFESNVPKILMGYFNTVLTYGVEKFCSKCEEHNIEGVILPDLPIDVYQEKYKPLFEHYNLSFIFLVTPNTETDRIRAIDELSTSFIYAVSSASTTGSSKGIKGSRAYFERLQSLNIKTPVMIGFNIKNKEDFDFASQYSSGGIIGSAFIKHIKNSTDLHEDTTNFIHSIRKND